MYNDNPPPLVRLYTITNKNIKLYNENPPPLVRLYKITNKNIELYNDNPPPLVRLYIITNKNMLEKKTKFNVNMMFIKFLQEF